jgi:hypothetical protein
VICAGTSDLPVAEEAAVVAELLGNRVRRVVDVGVAGLHRVLAHTNELRSARVIIVVAGMEGALPSVVAGLTDKPVIAVPTSVGYGASFQGVAALLGHVELLRLWGDRREHRQRLRGRLSGHPHQPAAMTLAWLDARAGLAGDMLCAALLDASGDAEALAAELHGVMVNLGLSGFTLRSEPGASRRDLRASLRRGPGE